MFWIFKFLSFSSSILILLHAKKGIKQVFDLDCVDGVTIKCWKINVFEGIKALFQFLILILCLIQTYLINSDVFGCKTLSLSLFRSLFSYSHILPWYLFISCWCDLEWASFPIHVFLIDESACAVRSLQECLNAIKVSACFQQKIHK